MIEANQAPKKSRVVILGLTFKENCPDIRNSKVNEIIKHLNLYGIQPLVADPWADKKEALREYGITLTRLEDVKEADCVIVAVAHDEFKELTLENIKKLYRESEDNGKVLIDVKGIYKIKDLEESEIKYWRL